MLTPMDPQDHLADSGHNASYNPGRAAAVSGNDPAYGYVYRDTAERANKLVQPK